MSEFNFPTTTIRKTIQLINSDNDARLRFLEKPRTTSSRIQSLLSVNMAAITIYRFSHWAFCNRLSIISKILYTLNIILLSCEITPMTVIGEGFILVHVNGTGLHGHIGKNAILFGQVVIGGQMGKQSDKGWLGGPVIGDNLTIGFGGKILTPATFGDNIFVAAASLVTKGFPSDTFSFWTTCETQTCKKPTYGDAKRECKLKTSNALWSAFFQSKFGFLISSTELALSPGAISRSYKLTSPPKVLLKKIVGLGKAQKQLLLHGNQHPRRRFLHKKRRTKVRLLIYILVR